MLLATALRKDLLWHKVQMFSNKYNQSEMRIFTQLFCLKNNLLYSVFADKG